MANSGNFPVNPPHESDGTEGVTEYELDLGYYFWPRWIRYPMVRLFRLEGDDGLTRWERKRLAKKYEAGVKQRPSPEAIRAYQKILEDRRGREN